MHSDVPKPGILLVIRLQTSDSTPHNSAPFTLGPYPPLLPLATHRGGEGLICKQKSVDLNVGGAAHSYTWSLLKETGNPCFHLCPLCETSGVTECASSHSCLKRGFFFSPQWREEQSSQRLWCWGHKYEEFLPELLSAELYVFSQGCLDGSDNPDKTRSVLI